MGIKRLLLLIALFLIPTAYLLTPIPGPPCTDGLKRIIYQHSQLKSTHGETYPSLYAYLNTTPAATWRDNKYNLLSIVHQCRGPEMGDGPTYECLKDEERKTQYEFGVALLSDRGLKYPQMLRDGLVECGRKRIRVVRWFYKVMARLSQPPILEQSMWKYITYIYPAHNRTVAANRVKFIKLLFFNFRPDVNGTDRIYTCELAPVRVEIESKNNLLAIAYWGQNLQTHQR